MPVYSNSGNAARIPDGEAVPAAISASAEQAFVARQPIFDQNKIVCAYELLFRASSASVACEEFDGNKATSEVIANTLFTFGVKDILGSRPGFLNFTREHLFVDYAGILDPKQIVIEVLETVQPDEEVIEACLRLKASGFTLALDDFVGSDLDHPLAKHADIIKVDFRGTRPAQQKSLAKYFRRAGITMLAEKVETPAEFESARSWGYTLFQGYFFARPEVVQGKRIPQTRKQYHSLLSALSRPDFDFNEIEAAIRHDLSLTYKFLLYLNSVRFGFLSRIDSIRRALILLGQQQVRTWLSLAIISSMGAGKPPELILTGTIRARFCELLGTKVGLADRSGSLFLLGLFSVMDAIMELPLREVLTGIQMEQDVLDALLGKESKDNRLQLVYSLVRANEIGDWETVIARTQQLGMKGDTIPALYTEAVGWAETVFRAEPK